MFKDLITKMRLPRKEVELKEGVYLFQSKKATPIFNLDGNFSIFVGTNALGLLKDVAKVDLEAIKPIPERIFEKCKELGLLRPLPLHCWVDSQPVANARGSNLLLAKVVPPMPFHTGALIDRSVIFFEPSVRQEIEIMKINNQTMTDLRALSKEDVSKELLDFDAIISAEMKMALAHELTHAFATDEYFGMLEKLGLELLELLTDAIGIVAYYDDYKGASPGAKHGFTRGFAYIANKIRRDNPMRIIDADQMVELMFLAAKVIIDISQDILKPKAEVETKNQA